MQLYNFSPLLSIVTNATDLGLALKFTHLRTRTSFCSDASLVEFKSNWSLLLIIGLPLLDCMYQLVYIAKIDENRLDFFFLVQMVKEKSLTGYYPQLRLIINLSSPWPHASS